MKNSPYLDKPLRPLAEVEALRSSTEDPLAEEGRDCPLCEGRGLVGGLLANGGGYQDDPCPACKGSGRLAEEGMRVETDPLMGEEGRMRVVTRVTAGPFTLELPPNGVAVLYEADEGSTDHRLPGGVGYLEALVQFAGEVIRLRAMVDTAAQSAWRSIVTAIDQNAAPWDGVPVLIVTNHNWGGPTNRVHRAFWTDEIHGSGIFGWAIQDNKFGPYPLRGYTQVTHWMPLPGAPEVAS